MKKPKVVWVNMVNLAGLYSPRPIKCSYKADLKSWWSADGNVEAKRLGLERKDNCVIFVSKTKQDAVLWTKGAAAVMYLLHSWSVT